MLPSATGLPFMLLDCRACSTIAGRSAAPTPRSLSRRTPRRLTRPSSQLDSSVGIRPAAQQLTSFGRAFEGGARAGVAQRAHVHGHDVRQKCGAYRAVRRVEHAADGGGQPVHRAQSRVGEGEAAEKAGQRHVGPRGRVVPVVARPFQRTRHAGDPVPAQRIRHRVRARGKERLDELRQRVQAGRGGDRGWKAVGQHAGR